MKWIKFFYQFIAGVVRSNISRAQYRMLVASLVGLVSGLVAICMKLLVHYVQHALTRAPVSKLPYLIFPAIGLLLTVFIIRRFFHGHIEKGIAMVLKAIARRSSVIPSSHTYLHMITSTITVGLGGSVGLEAPIVATGSAIGSNLARVHDLTYNERTLLIACGAAAGIAAVYNAPIAGVIFAIEVLLSETAVSYFIPLLISAAIGALCSRIILREGIELNFILRQTFNYHHVGFYILLGVLSGFISLYYARVFKSIETRIHRWTINPYYKAAAGGLMLFAICLFFPSLFGEGYSSVKSLANGNGFAIVENTFFFSHIHAGYIVILITGFVLLLKPVAAGITIGSGGNGGNFAPSVFVGAYLGFFFSKVINTTGLVSISEGNFSLVGMAGVLSGVMYCPLTAIFLIAEVTNGYELFIPLMIVSSISFFVVRNYEPYSMETKTLAINGQIFTHRKEQNILTSIRLAETMDPHVASINADKKLSDLVQVFQKSEHGLCAVTDRKHRFAGIIELKDLRPGQFDTGSLAAIPVRSLMKMPPVVIYNDEEMHTVMKKFDTAQALFLPVLDRENKLVGFSSKTLLFNRYREIVSANSDLYEN